ncbi:MAG: MAPEG family protein [Myxococcota bacterium]
MMTNEVSILALYGILVLLTLAIQSAATAGQFGIPYILSARDEARQAKGFAGRLLRTVDNSMVALVLFTAAVVVVRLGEASSPNTVAASQAFLASRTLYVVAYPAGVPYLRSTVWTVGFLSTAFLFGQAI